MKKKAFILTHLGLGDMVNCIGLFRYLSTVYDELLVVCKKVYYLAQVCVAKKILVHYYLYIKLKSLLL